MENDSAAHLLFVTVMGTFLPAATSIRNECATSDVVKS